MVPVPEQHDKLLFDVPQHILHRRGLALGCSSWRPNDQRAKDPIDGREARVRVVPEEPRAIDDAELDLLLVAVFRVVLQRALVDKGDAVVLFFFFFFLVMVEKKTGGISKNLEVEVEVFRSFSFFVKSKPRCS